MPLSDQHLALLATPDFSAALVNAQRQAESDRVILDVVDESLERAAKLRAETAKRAQERDEQQARLDRARDERDALAAERAAAQAQRAQLRAEHAQHRDEYESLIAEAEAKRAARNVTFDA